MCTYVSKRLCKGQNRNQERYGEVSFFWVHEPGARPLGWAISAIQHVIIHIRVQYRLILLQVRPQKPLGNNLDALMRSTLITFSRTGFWFWCLYYFCSFPASILSSKSAVAPLPAGQDTGEEERLDRIEITPASPWTIGSPEEPGSKHAMLTRNNQWIKNTRYICLQIKLYLEDIVNSDEFNS